MDSRDVVLQSVTPTVMVPLHGTLDPLRRPGHRFLAAGNGEWLEVRRSWLHARAQILPASPVAKPYGCLSDAIEWLMPAVPVSHFEAFAVMARASCPKEAAAWIVWNEKLGTFSLKPVGVRTATRGSIHFDRPRLEDDEHLVVDLHSHGTSGAFFSATDNEDDRGEVKIAVVLGHCDKDAFSTVMRLCLLGKFIALELASVSDGAITFKEKKMLKQTSSGGA